MLGEGPIAGIVGGSVGTVIGEALRPAPLYDEEPHEIVRMPIPKQDNLFYGAQ